MELGLGVWLYQFVFDQEHPDGETGDGFERAAVEVVLQVFCENVLEVLLFERE